MTIGISLETKTPLVCFVGGRGWVGEGGRHRCERPSVVLVTRVSTQHAERGAAHCPGATRAQRGKAPSSTCTAERLNFDAAPCSGVLSSGSGSASNSVCHNTPVVSLTKRQRRRLAPALGEETRTPHKVYGLGHTHTYSDAVRLTSRCQPRALHHSSSIVSSVGGGRCTLPWRQVAARARQARGSALSDSAFSCRVLQNQLLL